MLESYFTINKTSRIEIKIKGSRFIGEAFAADSIDQAVQLLQTIKKREHAASHHCYAYRLGLSGSEIFKQSDDGEPNGTAGRPIYDIITGESLTNLLLVVTRYFGGTKLGTGGLVRAYSQAARSAVKDSGIIEIFLTRRFRLKLDFAHYDSLLSRLEQQHAEVIESHFAERVELVIEVRVGSADQFEYYCKELSSGSITIEEADI